MLPKSFGWCHRGMLFLAEAKKKETVSLILAAQSLKKMGGQRWIRTTEGVSQQIYSLPHLATLVFARPLLFYVCKGMYYFCNFQA